MGNRVRKITFSPLDQLPITIEEIAVIAIAIKVGTDLTAQTTTY
jgi:hypothetical protein